MSDSLKADVEAIQVIDAVPKLLEVICRSTGMGFAAVARVTEDRWVACAVRDEIAFGLEPGGELDVVTTICNEIRASGQAVIIDDVDADPLFCRHHTPAHYGFKSYISVPIVHDEVFFGTLCAIDPAPRPLKASGVQKTFELFAELIGAHLAARGRLEATQQAVIAARDTEQLREHFTAVLGHDLRNPLASIDAGVRLLRKRPADPDRLLNGMDASVRRIQNLIENLLDLARGRLGGGVVVERKLDDGLAESLLQVVAELQLAHPTREITSDLAIGEDVFVDSRRLAQMLSNLIANALTHGAAGSPVGVRALIDGRVLEISVANLGDPIEELARAQLFKPFTRSQVKPRQGGLGLGLWICSEIARGHEGGITVDSDEDETRFTFRMPLQGRNETAGVAVP
jgi:signal transduction histidine kinase